MDTLPYRGESLTEAPLRAPVLAPVRVAGKFLFAGDAKLYVKGVTYGPFAAGSHGDPFPERDIVIVDFRLMAEMGANTVRVFTPPPLWLLDLAAEAGLRVLAGIPWSQHIAFLDDAETASGIVRAVAAAIRRIKGHPAILAFLIGNEVPPDMIRWHGRDRVRAFLKRLYDAAKAADPERLVSYANFPSSEYLAVDFTDFVSFNVYLHDEGAFRRYVARLHNLAFDKPLVLTEFGIDSMREGADEQARILSWQIKAAFEAGVAGTFVFAWTDEWFTGGHPIEDWDFGLVDRRRGAKPSFAAVAARFHGLLPVTPPRYPRVSVVVCSYNAERTLAPCLASLETLAYPHYEIIVVNDGSTDRTLEIAERFPSCRIISGPNRGLGAARNIGAEGANGEIVAYTDSDCVADPHWLLYLVATMERRGLVACGGPNFAPPEPSLVPAAVAVSPGGPTHVLLSDDVAEHIAGCNMAFRRDFLLGMGGFDPVFRVAGDDVDICWRVQDLGHEIGYSPSAMVWHFRRNTVAAYIGQQKGYGKAEALVLLKHPARFNRFGQAKWAGRIYGDLSSAMFPARQPFIYAGTFGRGLFQTLYSPPAPLASYLPLTFEWNVASLMLALAAIAAGTLAGPAYGLLALPLLLSAAMCVFGAVKAPVDRRFTGLKARALVALLIYLGPILRGLERLKWRIRLARGRPLPAMMAPASSMPTPMERGAPRSSWPLTSTWSFWSEQSREKEALLGGLMRLLPAHGYAVTVDDGWRGWDLEIGRGALVRGRVLAAAENHGGEKRLLRLRHVARLSPLALYLLLLVVAASVAALLAGALIPAAMIAAAGLPILGLAIVEVRAARRGVRGAVAMIARDEALRSVESRRPAIVRLLGSRGERRPG